MFKLLNLGNWMSSLSHRAPLSDSLLPLTATCGGLFTSCHRLPHVGEQSVLIHSTVRSISLAPVTHLPFPIYSGLCPLSVSVCHLWFVLPVVEDLLSHLHSVSRIPRRGVVSPLDSVSGLGARDGTPVHLFRLIIFLFCFWMLSSGVY